MPGDTIDLTLQFITWDLELYGNSNFYFRYSAELFATNLFDERNELSRFVACSVCTVAYVLPGRPRTFGLRLGTRF